ncbi:MAG TPA: PAS domain-containing protein [candidate division Zixibacteria bacterium]|nr:PAS domain-containing protein [candidate division Zixibacteria bacterium]
MMLRSVLGIIGLIFLFQVSLTEAATINVPGEAASIQTAIDRAGQSDTILVAPGIYRETLVFRGQDITLRSSGGAFETTLTGPDNAVLITLDKGETKATVIDGFTFRGGWIAIYCENSAATIHRNIFLDQKTTDWAAICLAGPGYPPSASYGAAPAVIEHNTILRSANGGISSFSTEPPTVRNNIIAFCAGYGVHFQGEFENIKLADNDVFGNTSNYINVFYAGVGSFSKDPLVDPRGILQGGSPCIDRSDTTDIDGHIVGHAGDIGADEFGGISAPYPASLILGPRALNDVIPGRNLTITWPRPETSYAGYQIQLSNSLDWQGELLWDSNPQLTQDTSVVYGGPPLAEGAGYYVRVRLYDGQFWGTWRCMPVITRSYLRIGCLSDIPPFQFVDSNDVSVGFDMEIVESVAAMLQRSVRITTTDPDRLQRLLENNEIDVITGMPYSTERDRFFDFTPPYSSIRYTVYGRTGTTRVNTIEDLRNMPIAVPAGGFMSEFVYEHGLTDRLIPVTDAEDGLRRLSKGEFPYLLLGRISGSYWIDRLHLNDVGIIGPVITSAQVCLAVNQNNADLQAELTEGLNMLHRTGQYQEIGERWLGSIEPERWSRWSIVKNLLYVLIPLILITGAITLWNWSLRRTVVRRTEDLNKELAERKRTQAALEESESLARALLRAPTDSICLVATDMTMIDCNETVEKRLGIKREEIIGREISDLVPPDVAKARISHVKLTMETGKPCRFEDIHQGRCLDNVCYPVFDSRGRVSSIATISRDISERKRMEEKVKESEARLRALVDSAQDVIFMKDCHSRYVLVNRTMLELFGKTAEEILNSTSEQLVGEEVAARMIETDKRVLAGETYSEQHTIMIRQTRRIFDVVAVPMRKSDGEIIGICGIARDITETVRLQRFSERAKRLEAAGRIAGQVAHDFNNLLGPLLAYPDLIREQLPENSNMIPLLDDIERSAEQMAEINQQLLTLGRRGHYNQNPVDLNTVVRQVLQRFELDSPSIMAHSILESGLLPIVGGASQIQRAVANLVTNAYEAVHGVGAITVVTSNRYFDQDHDGFERIPAGEYVQLTVTDTGPGIPPDILGRIFDPFFSTKRADRRRGSGLGLSVVHAVVKDHQGYIDVASNLTKGTEFSLFFPAARDAVVLNDTREISGGQGHILVVDDDPGQLRVSRTLLEKLGYSVHTVESGEKALEVIASHRFDLVLLDMIMPNGIDGTRTLERILEIRPGQKALIISGYAETDRVKQALELGAVAFVRKPLTLKTLAAAVKAGLSHSRE